jgi:hypothetical protein
MLFMFANFLAKQLKKSGYRIEKNYFDSYFVVSNQYYVEVFKDLSIGAYGIKIERLNDFRPYFIHARDKETVLNLLRNKLETGRILHT